MAKKFIVHLISVIHGMFTYEVNCADIHQAMGIAQGVFPHDRVIEIEEIT